MHASVSKYQASAFKYNLRTQPFSMLSRILESFRFRLNAVYVTSLELNSHNHFKLNLVIQLQSILFICIDEK